MPISELHADFDRDGWLTGSPAARSARTRWPGAVVVPNKDRERRALSTSVGSASQVGADYELVSTITGDDELLRVEVRAAPGAIRSGGTLHLRCSGVMHTRVKLSDDTGRIVLHCLQAPEIYDLPPMPPSELLTLTLEVRTGAGAVPVDSVDIDWRALPRSLSVGAPLALDVA